MQTACTLKTPRIMSLLKNILLICYRSKASVTDTTWKVSVHADLNGFISDSIIQWKIVLCLILEKKKKRNETPNTILNMTHISSLNSVILKSQDIPGKKSYKQILMHWKRYCQKIQTKPRVCPWRALAGLS